MRTSIALLFVFITVTMLFGHSSGLSCWLCSSLLDKNCGDDSFSGKTSLLIMKKDCTEVSAISLPDGGNVPRTIPVTKCITIKVKNLHARSCASPGEYDLMGVDESLVGCKTVEGATICMCKGDYCNGTGASKLAIHLAIISLLAFLLI